MSGCRGTGRCTVVVLVEVEQGWKCRTRRNEGKSAREMEGLFAAFCTNAQESARKTKLFSRAGSVLQFLSVCVWERDRKRDLHGRQTCTTGHLANIP